MRIRGLGLGLVVLGWLWPLVGFAAGARTTVQETQIQGPAPIVASRLATSAYPKGAKAVVLTSASLAHLADAVTAAPLAALLKAPILLTTSDTQVGAATEATLKALAPRRVILVGAVDNPAIRSQLPSGATVVAYRGSSRYQTAFKVAEAVAGASGPLNHLYFASGNNQNLTDALTVDPIAAAERAPILLLPPGGGVPAVYQPLIRRARMIFVVGAAAKYHARLPHPLDLAGVDRYTTAAEVNQRFFPRPSGVVVTNAAFLLDALAASPWAGMHRQPVVMVNQDVIPGPSYDYLASLAGNIHSVLTVGTSGAILPQMAKAVASLVQTGH